MPISGKYDFPGIKKAGANGLKLLLAASPYTAWFLKLGVLADLILEFIVNFLANKGLIVMNIGAILVEGEIDQNTFDSAMDQAIKQVEVSDGKLTPEQMKAIDDQVIQAFRKFASYSKLGKPTTGLLNDASGGLPSEHNPTS